MWRGPKGDGLKRGSREVWDARKKVRRVGGPKSGGPKDDGSRTFRASFSLSRCNFVLSLLSTDLLVELWSRIKTRDPSKDNGTGVNTSIKYPMMTSVFRASKFQEN